MANKHNAQLSTGPKTPEGKAKASQNSRKHGIRSRKLYLLESEDPEEWRALAESYHKEYEPLGPHQEGLVNRMVLYDLIIDRCNRIEVAILTSDSQLSQLSMLKMLSPSGRWEEPELPYAERVAALREYVQHGHRLDTNDELLGANQMFQVMTLEKGNERDLEQLFTNFSDNLPALALLNRYRTGAENSYYRALHELERDKACMRGEDVPSPMEVDLNFNCDTSLRPPSEKNSYEGEAFSPELGDEPGKTPPEVTDQRNETSQEWAQGEEISDPGGDADGSLGPSGDETDNDNF